MQVAMLQTLKPVSENVQITGRFHATSYTTDPDRRRSSARIHRTPIPTGDKAPPAILGAQPHPQLTGRPPAVEGAIADQVDMAVLGLIHHNRSGSADSLQLVMGSCLLPTPGVPSGVRRSGMCGAQPSRPRAHQPAPASTICGTFTPRY